ncbi:MAG: response regulator [Verrucomicrobia bacterium]|nr:response regulator [Verrucomicrobiota bacterium]
MPSASKPRPGRPLRILVVDDERLLRESVNMLLSYDGHQVELANDGDEALVTLAAKPFDVVLTDFEMPKMRGDHLAVAIKERWPELPVIMLSAYGEIFKAEGKQFPGVDLILSKPFLLATLRQALVTVLGTEQGEAGPLTPPSKDAPVHRKRPGK